MCSSHLRLWACLIGLWFPLVTAATPAKEGSGRRSWAQLRDQGVVKQQFDYSCGASSLATLLTHSYHHKVTELELLKMIDQKDREKSISFFDMTGLLKQMGYRSVGLAADLETLKKLKIPALLYFHRKKQDHFTILKGINDSWVWVADPTWGNRKMSHRQFLKYWKTRPDEQKYGRLLLVYPKAGVQPPEPLLKNIPISLVGRRLFLEHRYP